VEEAPIVALPPVQIADADPAFAAGKALTVIFTLFDLLQPVEVIVSVRV